MQRVVHRGRTVLAVLTVYAVTATAAATVRLEQHTAGRVMAAHACPPAAEPAAG
jgi:hypothetical protein